MLKTLAFLLRQYNCGFKAYRSSIKLEEQPACTRSRGLRHCKVFFEIHSGLPREGPGGNESKEKAYFMLRNLPDQPRVLDIGCGPGMQTIVLANLSPGRIIAVDNHQPFLDYSTQKAEAEGVSDSIEAVYGDICALNYSTNSFDVVWAEGSIFVIVFERGLRE